MCEYSCIFPKTSQYLRLHFSGFMVEGLFSAFTDRIGYKPHNTEVYILCDWRFKLTEALDFYHHRIS